MALYFTAMIVWVRDDAFLSCCCSARDRNSLAYGSDVKVLPLYVHTTDDVLSQKLPMCLNAKSSTTYYSTIHPRIYPANSILFIVNLPFGFV